MRRENRGSIKGEGVDFKKVLYISGSILAVAIIGFVITFFVYGKNLEQNNTNLGKMNTSIVDDYVQNTEEASSSFGKTVNEMSNQEITNEMTNDTANEISDSNTVKYAVNTSGAEDNITDESIETSENSVQASNNKTSELNTEEQKEETIKDPEFKRPVEGEIIREFAKDKLVYSNTLGEWITHNGIDIKADKTTVVKASSEGTIKSIKNDPRYGLTVVIEHVNGFTTVYSNLLTAEFVVEGEQVKQGQTIGTVGNTATFEIADEAHLHFEIAKDGEGLDPELYLKD